MAGDATRIDLATVQAAVRHEAHFALERGSLVAMGLGGVSAAVIGILLALDVLRHFQVPFFFALTGALYSLLVWSLARRRRLEGAVLYAVFLVFVSYPTVFMLLAEWVLPAGAATYINGGMPYLYFFLIAVSGFMFDVRLSVACGFAAGAGYLAAWCAARRGLAELSHPDPVFLQDYTSPAVYGLKGMILVFTGILVGMLSLLTRRLILRVLRESREKGRINRLFGMFVSEEVVDRILAEQSGEVKIAERKRVVVLFADLRGFSSYSEERDPREVVAALNEYFDAMVACIVAHGGVVDKFMGDAVMAVFGGLLPLEAPAERALEAARRMRRRLGELNRRRAARGQGPLANGIGLDFGEVLQGTIGGADRKEFTVIGDTVNTAARLESLTREQPQHPILVSAAFAQALSEPSRQTCEPLGRVQLKGKQREVEVFGVRDEATAEM